MLTQYIFVFKYLILFFYSNMENPQKEIAISPAVIKLIGIPRKLSGTSFSTICFRIPAKIIIVNVNPMEATNA